MKNADRLFWAVIYRSLVAIAAAIKTRHLTPPPPDRHPFDTEFWRKYFLANGIPFPWESPTDPS